MRRVVGSVILTSVFAAGILLAADDPPLEPPGTSLAVSPVRRQGLTTGP